MSEPKRIILYSFRRCPYAIRARMMLAYAKIEVELREVDLKHKPQALLDISPKATVPVLQLDNGQVIDESLDIMRFAITQHDPDAWGVFTQVQQQVSDHWIEQLDSLFVPLLRRYKYFERYPESSQEEYRKQMEMVFLAPLEAQLSEGFIHGKQVKLTDIAMFPFVRQCAFVDMSWWQKAPYPSLQKWLEHFLDHPIFDRVMQKFDPWYPEMNANMLG